jgi:hypothetical protein
MLQSFGSHPSIRTHSNFAGKRDSFKAFTLFGKIVIKLIRIFFFVLLVKEVKKKVNINA